MTSRVLDIEKKGFIVYKFYEDDRGTKPEDDKFFRAMKVAKVPTIIVFNKGKEVRRHTGITEIEKITKGVKTKKQQEGSWYPDWLKLW